jgi:hypothetical protein
VTIDRVLVYGYPRDAVARLDAKLRRHSGGAQIWRLAGDGRTVSAVGIDYPPSGPQRASCRDIVRAWSRQQELA